MKDQENILLELMHGNDRTQLDRFLATHPELQDAFSQYTEIFKGFNALKVDGLAQKFDSNNKNIEENITRGFKAMQVDNMADMLASHSRDKSQSTGKSNIRFLNPRRLSIAASFLILIAAALWFLIPDSTDSVLEQFAQPGIAMNIRGDNDSQLVNNLFASNDRHDWAGTVDAYEAYSGPKSEIAQYHYAFALMQLRHFSQAARLFDQVHDAGLVQWSDMAEFNRVLCLYLDDKGAYEKQLLEIADNKSHLMHDKAANLADQLKIK